MARLHAKVSVTFSLIASAGLHLAVVIPLLTHAMEAPSSPLAINAEPSQRDDPRDAPQLGLDAVNPPSLTWIGYEQYEEHMAALAEFEQAAFTEHPGQTDQQRAAEASEPAPQSLQPAVETPPNELPMEPAPQPAPETAPDSAPEPTSEPAAEAVPLIAPLAAPQLDRSVVDVPWLQAVLEAMQQQSPATQARPTVKDGSAQPLDQPKDEPNPPSQPQQPTPPQQESPPQADAPGDTPADPADKESDATSTINADVENWRHGRPLAAQGVELKPRQPQFTILQRLTASPGNPLVVISFGSDGAPRFAVIEESSGSASVDAAIQASLYRWRAEGEAIDALEGEATFDVSIRIILNRRAPH